MPTIQTLIRLFLLALLTAGATADESNCGAQLSANKTGSISTSLNDLKNNPVETSADAASLEQGVARFEGNVIFHSGDVELQADKANYHQQSQRVSLEGKIVIKSPEATIFGSSAEIDLENNASQISDAEYRITDQNMRGTATSVALDQNDRVTVTGGSYTRCEPNNKIWEVKAKKILLDQQSGQGKARHAKLSIYDTPIFYLPYVQFPIGDQRQSGFLFPKLSDTNTGFDVAQPYYFNIAPNIDATIAPRYKDGNGYLTEGELRWLNPIDSWSISGSYIDSDDSFNQRSRWLINVNETGQIGAKTTTRIDYTQVSDVDYLRDLNTTSLSVNRATQLSQSAALRYADTQWELGLSIQQYQTIDANPNPSRPFEKRPELWLQYRSSQPVFQPGAELDLRYSLFDHASLQQGARSYGRIGVNYPMRWQGIAVTPTIGIEQQYYRLDATESSAAETLSLSAPYATLAMGTSLEKYVPSSDESPAKRKTLEPMLFYAYRQLSDGQSDSERIPSFDSNLLTFNQSLFNRISRFGGYDRLEEANQLTAVLSHKHFSATGRQLLSIDLGQIFYFDRLTEINSDDSTQNRNIDQSVLLTELNYSPHKRWQTTGQLLWDSENDQIDQGSLGLRYRSARNLRPTGTSLVNLGYHYRRKMPIYPLLDENIEQVELSTVSYIGRHWGLVGKYQYDIQNDRHAESLAGFEYDDCCIKLRFVFRDGLIYDSLNSESDERDRSFFLQIEFKGLMGVGRTLENVLSESILGYGLDY